MLYMLHHCEFHLIWLQSKLYMGSVCSVAMGIARWSFRLIKDIHFRGLHNDNSSCCLIPSSHITMQICDETNQSKGFAMIATMGGIGRIFVCKMIHVTLHTYYTVFYHTGLTDWRISGSSSQQVPITQYSFLL